MYFGISNPTKIGIDMMIPEIMSNSIRYPPGSNPPNALVSGNKLRENLDMSNASINPKLQDFALMYRKMSSGLLDMSAGGIIPPGHPLFNREGSISTLKEENDKLLKENLELKKKLEQKS